MYQKLEKLMKEHNETAADLSRATGISEAQISMWKKRNGGMSAKNAVIVAKHYNVSVEDLLKEGD